MSDYGLNFGFLRSDESSRSSAEGRFKTPVGSALLLGTLVEVDPANAGYLKQAAAASVPVTGYCGLLLQELDFERSIYESDVTSIDSFQKGVAKPNRLAIITGGAGTKIWLRNTAGQNRVDGRVISARTMVANAAAVAVGDQLGWNGTQWATGATNPFMKVTAVSPSKLLVEAVLIK